MNQILQYQSCRPILDKHALMNNILKQEAVITINRQKYFKEILVRMAGLKAYFHAWVNNIYVFHLCQDIFSSLEPMTVFAPQYDYGQYFTIMP